MTSIQELLSLEVLIIVAALGIALHFAPHGLRLLQQARLRKRCHDQRAIVLSYDDGPSRSMTPALLELLAHAGRRASFFILGRSAEAAPDLVATVAANHELGTHGHAHVNSWYSTPWRVARDMAQGVAALQGRVGPRSWFRPPYGKLSAGSLLAASRRGFRFAWWTLDSGDTWATIPRVDEVIDRVRAEGGGVILMHDHHEDDSRRSFVLELTTRLLALEQENFRIKTLDEIHEAGA